MAPVREAVVALEPALLRLDGHAIVQDLQDIKRLTPTIEVLRLDPFDDAHPVGWVYRLLTDLEFHEPLRHALIAPVGRTRGRAP